MAQHIPLEKIKLKGFQKVYKSICKNFENGSFYAKSSLKYQAISDKSFKENEYDMVFETWRSVNGQQEFFEVHYNSQDKQLTNIYFVK